MTVATPKDYWLSPNALHIERNALGYPDYIQASCISGAQILVYIKGIISYDAGHNYRRWPLQASPTVFNTHTEKYVYVAVPRDSTLSSAIVVYPSELLDIYGKNDQQQQVGSEKYYYIFLQGILSSSGDNGTVQRDWLEGHTVLTGYLSSNEAINAGPDEAEWFQYSTVDEIVTFLKDLTMKAGTKFRELFAKAVTIVSGGYITFEGKTGSVSGIANADTSVESEADIVTPKYMDGKALSKSHNDKTDFDIELKNLRANGTVDVFGGLTIGRTEDGYGVTGEGAATLSTVVVDEVRDPKSTEQDRVIVGAQGFNLYMGKDGKSHLYIDYLMTRTKFFAASAEVRKVSYSGGTTLFSNAGSTIMKVAHVLDDAGVTVGYKCYAAADDGTTRTANWWHVGMMALCQTFNVKAGETENLQNRYYWRLVVGVGQETLEDGKLYDYVILSNRKTFAGSDSITEDGRSLAAVFEEQEGKTTDDGNNVIANRMFFGYEPAADGGEPDVPQPYDVIVQAGDQIQWNRFGNLIKLTTSTEDGSDNGNAPAIAIYHAMGAPYKTGDTVNPYQWKTLTSLDSPLLVLKNAKNFKFFTDDNPDNIIDPVTVTYDLVPSSEYIIRKPNSQTATPNDITFTLRKRTGNVTEDMKDGYLLTADYTTTAGESKSGVAINRLSDIGVSFYLLASVTVRATVKADNTTVTLTLPILSDGAKGDTGTSFKVLGYALAHAKTYAELQQITPTDGGLYLVDDTTGMEGGGKKPCVVQWKNGKYIVCDSNDGDSYKIGEILWTNTGTYWLDIGSVKGEGVVISDMSVTYAISDSATVTPTEWQSAIIAATDAKPYLWTRTTVTYKDSEGEHTTVSYAIAYKGKDGDKGDPGANGKDAVEFILKNAPLVFDTDEIGVVSSTVSKTAQIQVMRSDKNIVSEVGNLFPSNNNVGCGKPTLTRQTDGIDVTISGASINKDSTLGVSVTSGYVIVYMAIGGTLYSRQIPFMVNVAKFTGTISADNKKLRTDYTELTNRVGAVETDVNGIPIKTQGELKKYTSTIEQTAREISLKVTEETVNMARNCIVGSALREYDEITPINGTEKVTIMTQGVGGTNYAQCYCIGATANSWTGLYFKDVRVKPQTKYIFSVWMRMTAKPDNGSYVAIKTYNTSVTGTEVARIAFPDSQTLNVWALYKVTVSVPAACNRLLIETGVRKNGAIDLCRPMLEEGDTYQGWSLSPYDVTIDDAVVATGLDIKNGIIKATADKFEIRNNNGEQTAAVNEKGRLEVKSGLFSGLIVKKMTTLTPDNISEYLKSSQSNGYLSMDFSAAGSYVCFTGAMKAKYGDDYPSPVLPFYNIGSISASLGVTAEEAISYIGQIVIIANKSDTTVNVIGGGTIKGGGTQSPWIETGYMAVLACEFEYTSVKSYKIVWNGYCVKI
jgi:hypothetical protein